MAYRLHEVHLRSGGGGGSERVRNARFRPPPRALGTAVAVLSSVAHASCPPSRFSAPLSARTDQPGWSADHPASLAQCVYDCTHAQRASRTPVTSTRALRARVYPYATLNATRTPQGVHPDAKATRHNVHAARRASPPVARGACLTRRLLPARGACITPRPFTARTPRSAPGGVCIQPRPFRLPAPFTVSHRHVRPRAARGKQFKDAEMRRPSAYWPQGCEGQAGQGRTERGVQACTRAREDAEMRRPSQPWGFTKLDSEHCREEDRSRTKSAPEQVRFAGPNSEPYRLTGALSAIGWC